MLFAAQSLVDFVAGRQSLFDLLLIKIAFNLKIVFVAHRAYLRPLPHPPLRPLTFQLLSHTVNNEA